MSADTVWCELIPWVIYYGPLIVPRNLGVTRLQLSVSLPDPQLGLETKHSGHASYHGSTLSRGMPPAGFATDFLMIISFVVLGVGFTILLCFYFSLLKKSSRTHQAEALVFGWKRLPSSSRIARRRNRLKSSACLSSKV